jgi:hypothetical protein
MRLQGTWTDERTDRVIPIYPPNFVCGGYNNNNKKRSKHNMSPKLRLEDIMRDGLYSLQTNRKIMKDGQVCRLGL